MKTTTRRLRGTIGLAAASLLGLPALPAKSADSSPRPAGAVMNHDNSMGTRGARQLMGLDVISRTGDKLGDISDFILDAHTGRVVFAVVDSGGFVGIGQTRRAIPVTLLDRKSTGHDAAILDLDPAKWKSAPTFDPANLSYLSDPDQISQLYRQYGQSWSASEDTPATPHGHRAANSDTGNPSLVLASDVIGRDVNRGDKKLGEIDDLVLRLGQRKAEVLLDLDADVGATDHFVVSFDQLQPTGSDDGAYLTTLTMDDFRRAAPARPATDDLAATDAIVYPYAWAGYGYPGSTALTTEMAMNRPDQPPVAAVRIALKQDGALRSDAKNVTVAARGDQVVLKGTVTSQDACDRIEDKAEKAARGWDVDNQLRVASND